MTVRVCVVSIALTGASCAHGMSAQPNTADVSRPFVPSNAPVASTIAIDMTADGISPHMNERPVDRGTPLAVTFVPAPP